VNNDADDPQTAAPAQAPSAGYDPTIVNMPLFHAGQQVNYQGRVCTVSHVIVGRDGLKVNLKELDESISAEKLRTPLTQIVLKRR
jgi:hypothetical protein